MENWKKEFIAELKEKRTTYADMIDFCCDNMVLNNSIMPELSARGFYFDVYCAPDNDDDEYYYDDEIYQQFIISERDAERLAEYTNEIVYFNEELDLYLLCVTHYGTMWSGVSANWKSENEIEN